MNNSPTYENNDNNYENNYENNNNENNNNENNNNENNNNSYITIANSNSNKIRCS